jgi:hypothetical protein
MSASADSVKKIVYTPFKPIRVPKKESIMISKLRQLCLDLPEDPSCGGYVFEDWTLYELMTSPVQPYKKLKRVITASKR